MYTADIILTVENRKQFLKIRNALFAIAVPSVMYLKSSKDWQGTLWGHYVVALVLVLFLIVIIIHIYSRRKKVVGKIEFYQNTIITIANNKKLEFYIPKLSGLTVTQDMMEGKAGFNSMMSFYDNWISFSDEGKDYNFQFRIQSQFDRKQFSETLKEWNEIGHSFKLKV